MDPELAEKLNPALYGSGSREALQKLQKVLFEVEKVLKEDYADKVGRGDAKAILNLINCHEYWEVAQTAMPQLREPFDPTNSLGRPRALQFILDSVKDRTPNNVLTNNLSDIEKDLITTLSDIIAFLKNLNGPQDARACCSEVLQQLASELNDRALVWRRYREDERLHQFKVPKGPSHIFNAHNLKASPPTTRMIEQAIRKDTSIQYDSTNPHDRAQRRGVTKTASKLEGSPLKQEFTASEVGRETQNTGEEKMKEPRKGLSSSRYARVEEFSSPETSKLVTRTTRQELGRDGGENSIAQGRGGLVRFQGEKSVKPGLSDTTSKLQAIQQQPVQSKQPVPKASGLGQSRWAPAILESINVSGLEDWEKAWYYQSVRQYRLELGKHGKVLGTISQSSGSENEVTSDLHKETLLQAIDPANVVKGVEAKLEDVSPAESSPAFELERNPTGGVTYVAKPKLMDPDYRSRLKVKKEPVEVEQSPSGTGFEVDSEGGVAISPSIPTPQTPATDLNKPPSPPHNPLSNFNLQNILQHMWAQTPGLEQAMKEEWQKNPGSRQKFLHSLVAKMTAKSATTESRDPAPSAVHESKSEELPKLNAASLLHFGSVKEGEEDDENDDLSPRALANYLFTLRPELATTHADDGSHSSLPTVQEFRDFIAGEVREYPQFTALMRERFKANPQTKPYVIGNVYKALLEKREKDKVAHIVAGPVSNGRSLYSATGEDPRRRTPVQHFKRDIDSDITPKAQQKSIRGVSQHHTPSPVKFDSQQTTPNSNRPTAPTSKQPIPFQERASKTPAGGGFEDSPSKKQHVARASNRPAQEKPVRPEDSLSQQGEEKSPGKQFDPMRYLEYADGRPVHPDRYVFKADPHVGVRW